MAQGTNLGEAKGVVEQVQRWEVCEGGDDEGGGESRRCYEVGDGADEGFGLSGGGAYVGVEVM